MVVNTFIKNINHADERIRALSLKYLCALKNQIDTSKNIVINAL